MSSFKLNSSDTNRILKFMSAFKFAESVNIRCDESGLSIHMNDLSVQGVCRLPVICDEPTEFILNKDVFKNIIKNTSVSVSFFTNDSNAIKVVIDKTELNLASIDASFDETYIIIDKNDFNEVEVSSSRFEEIVANMAVVKTNNSFMINVMELSEKSKYGSSAHMLSYQTPELKEVSCNVTSEFYRFMSALVKFKEPVQITKSCGHLLISVEGVQYITELSSMNFEDIEEVFEQDCLIEVSFNKIDIVSEIKSTVKNFFIPLIGMEDPQASLIMKNTSDILTVQIENMDKKISKESFVIGLDYHSGEENLVVVNFESFANVITKQKEIPFKMKVLESAVIITNEKTTEIIFKFI